jgi:hypothetical protein
LRDIGLPRQQFGRCGAAADDDQVVAAAQHAHRFQQHVELLFRREAARVDEQSGVGMQSQVRAQRGVAALRAEHAAVDAQRLVDGPVHAHFVELRDHDAARRHHEVELAVQVGEITAGAARDPAAQARPHQARQVGMVEGYGRDVEALAHAQRGPGTMPGVAGLDEVGLHGSQQTRRRRHGQRHAVAVEAGQPGRGNADQRGNGVVAGFDVGTHDRVLHTAAPGQPMRLGVQVGAHAAAFGRVEHRDVDKMHRGSV